MSSQRIRRLAGTSLLVDGGWLYLETPQPLATLPEGLREHRRLRAGAVSVQLLQAGEQVG